MTFICPRCGSGSTDETFCRVCQEFTRLCQVSRSIPYPMDGRVFPPAGWRTPCTQLGEVLWQITTEPAQPDRPGPLRGVWGGADADGHGTGRRGRAARPRRRGPAVADGETFNALLCRIHDEEVGGGRAPWVKGLRVTTRPGTANSRERLWEIVCAHAAQDGSIRADQIASLIADIEQRLLAELRRSIRTRRMGPRGAGRLGLGAGCSEPWALILRARHHW
jgi:hypothetical protein